MGALAAVGCAWSVRGEPGYAGKWAGLARRGRSTPRNSTGGTRPMGASQRPVRVDCGLSYSTVQALCIILMTSFPSSYTVTGVIRIQKESRYCWECVPAGCWSTETVYESTVSRGERS